RAARPLRPAPACPARTKLLKWNQVSLSAKGACVSYRHVLIAVDFSSASEHVTRRAAAISQRNSAVLSLLHVVDYLPPLGFADDLLPAPALLVDEQELIGHGMASLEAFARKTGLPADAARHVRLG